MIYIIGIDPGFGETGMVLRTGKKLRAFATYSCPPNGCPFERTISLGMAVLEQCEAWVRQFRIDELEVVIETPIWNANAYSHEVQWRLVQSIEEGLECLPLRSLYLVEVSPKTSKKLLTGNGGATKTEMVAHSPFARMEFDKDTKEALADAWAHSQAALGSCIQCRRYDLRNLSEAKVIKNV